MLSTNNRDSIKLIVDAITPKKYNNSAFLDKVVIAVGISKTKTLDKVLRIIRDCLTSHLYPNPMRSG